MAFDGIVIANLAMELNRELAGGRITKIAQPEKDELLLTVKQSRAVEGEKTVRMQRRLMISVNPSLPLIYLTQENKNSPMTAPTFCMVLRKHLNNCKIIRITQPGLERVLQFELEHLNEMGDLCHKYLFVELMGKHSNIIFCQRTENEAKNTAAVQTADNVGKDEDSDVKMPEYTVIDSIKHVSLLVSSVREVLPGREYFIPNTQEKKDPYRVTEQEFLQEILQKPLPPAKAVYTSLIGFSPVMAQELIFRAGLSDKNTTSELTEMEKLHLFRNFERLRDALRQQCFQPIIVRRGKEPIEFSSLPLTSYEGDGAYEIQNYGSASEMLFDYYAAKETYSRIRQKSIDLRKITNTALERNRKKYDLQIKQLRDTEKREKYKVYGELLTTYGYSLSGGEKSLTCENYYTDQEITIPLDPELDAVENAKKYFNRYAKLKRTFEALTIQIKETKEEIDHLESISNSLDIAIQEEDLAAVRRELTEYGYMKRHSGREKGKKQPGKSKPFHYLSSDGYHIYVGRNNYQNDELTFQMAGGGDWWFHAKKAAGSHVILKTDGQQEIPDRAFEEAASLAAWYSSAREQTKVEIDYVQRKHVKKPGGSKPGFVVYYTNYSMTIAPDISALTEVSEP